MSTSTKYPFNLRARREAIALLARLANDEHALPRHREVADKLSDELLIDMARYLGSAIGMPVESISPVDSVGRLVVSGEYGEVARVTGIEDKRATQSYTTFVKLQYEGDAAPRHVWTVDGKPTGRCWAVIE